MSFYLLHERAMSPELVSLNPAIDLLVSTKAQDKATGQSSGGLTVHRTAMTWQRTCVLPGEEVGGNEPISALTWSPNGHTIAVGHGEGSVSLLAAETAEQEGGSRQLHEGKAIVAMVWAGQEPALASRRSASHGRAAADADTIAALQARYLNRSEHFLGELGTDGSADHGKHELGLADGGTGAGGSGGGVGGAAEARLLRGMLERPLTVLATADAGGKVVLSVHGVFKIAEVDLGGSGGDGGRPVAARPLRIAFSRDLQVLSALADVGGRLEWRLTALPLLWWRRHSLRRLASCYAAMRARLTRLDTAAVEAAKQWDVVLRGLGAKFEQLGQTLADHGHGGAAAGGGAAAAAASSSPRDELLTFLATGYATPPLRHFFANQVPEGLMVRLQKSSDVAAGSVEAALRDCAGTAARSLLFHAADLRTTLTGWGDTAAAASGAAGGGVTTAGNGGGGGGSACDGSSRGGGNNVAGGGKHEPLSRKAVPAAIAPAPAGALAPAAAAATLCDACADTCVLVELALRRAREARAHSWLLLEWMLRAAPKAGDGRQRAERPPPTLQMMHEVLRFMTCGDVGNGGGGGGPIAEAGAAEQQCTSGGTFGSSRNVEALLGVRMADTLQGPASDGSGAGDDCASAAVDVEDDGRALRSEPTLLRGLPPRSLVQQAALLRKTTESVFAAARTALNRAAAVASGRQFRLGSFGGGRAMALHSRRCFPLPGGVNAPATAAAAAAAQDGVPCLLAAVAATDGRAVWILAIPQAAATMQHGSGNSPAGPADASSDMDSDAESDGEGSADEVHFKDGEDGGSGANGGGRGGGSSGSRDMASAPAPADVLFAACVLLPRGFRAHQLAFYGARPGVVPPGNRPPRPEHLTLLAAIEPDAGSEDGGDTAAPEAAAAGKPTRYELMLFRYDDLDFAAIPADVAEADDMLVAAAAAAATTAAAAAGAAPSPAAGTAAVRHGVQSVDLAAVAGLRRRRLEELLVDPALVVSGTRGTLCVYGRPSRRTGGGGGTMKLELFDAEEDDEESDSADLEDEEDAEGGADGEEAGGEG